MGLSPFKFIKALSEMKKQGGMYLCEDCIMRQIKKTTDHDLNEAYNKSMRSGAYKEMEQPDNCFICSKATKIMINYNDALKAIGAHRH